MKAIGIDLGTTNSVAAIDKGDGSPHPLSTRARESFTPSVVSFSQGELLVGRQAWNNAAVAPEDTIFSIKRLMGRAFDDEQVAKVRKHYPYTVAPADDPDDRGVRVVISGVKYTPEDVSAMILRQIVEDASQALGEQVTHAVITVPAYFSEVQREATRQAGEQAGLIIKKIIDEPTAAAVAFGTGRPDEAHTLLVFDMGGGTLDVSILYAADREFAGMTITGDMWLGGDDFDREIVRMIVEWARRNFGVDPSDDKRFLMLARRAAEQAKRHLTDKHEADIVIPGCFSLPGGQSGSVTMTVSRSEFEAAIRHYAEKSVQLVHEAMAEKDLDSKDISTVLLVGGATYVPLVRQALVDIFGPDKVKHHMDPMEAVALGAAILAEQLEGVECPNPKCQRLNPYDATACEFCGVSLSTARATGGVGLYEITERDLGIGAVYKGDPDVFSVIIPAGTPYPLEQPMRERYVAVGRQITIPVYVGHAGTKPKASQNEYVGLVEYELPPDTSPRTPVFVQFNYDRNRILKVRVEVEGRPDIRHEVTPKRHGFDPSKVSDDKWRTGLQNTIAFAEMMIEKYGDFIEPDQKKTLEDDVQQTQDALREQNPAAGQQALNKLMHTVDDLGIASRLLLTDHLMHEVDPDTSQWLAEQSKRLRDAHRDGDSNLVTQIRRALDTTIKHIIETMPAGQDIGYHGLLEIMGD